MYFRKEFLIVVVLLTVLLAFTFYEPYPVKRLMDWRSSKNALAENEITHSDYQIFDHTQGHEPEITVDFRKGKHFWNPQVAIWLEDSSGKFIETLLVTTSTAKGLFYSGRSASNFKENDEVKKAEVTPTRRVDALPYWSHKRGYQYPDGMYSPPPFDPMPDAITGATPRENFYFKTAKSALKSMTRFRILVEVNVAFDENEYYSEYDFLEDSLYHSGTGLLGQPSVIYGTTINRNDSVHYYILTFQGHGHHSGSSGELHTETKTLTTAMYISERIVVGVNDSWYRK